jgi:uncharacterized membrane protein YqgA involved in biofilm formation
MILKYSLVVVVFLTIAGIAVLVFNDRSAEDTFYDILFFVVGAMALIVGLGSSLDVRYQRRVMRKLHLEISEAVAELRNLDKENDKILKELEKDEELDREMIEKMDDKL